MRLRVAYDWLLARSQRRSGRYRFVLRRCVAEMGRGAYRALSLLRGYPGDTCMTRPVHREPLDCVRSEAGRGAHDRVRSARNVAMIA